MPCETTWNPVKISTRHPTAEMLTSLVEPPPQHPEQGLRRTVQAQNNTRHMRKAVVET